MQITETPDSKALVVVDSAKIVDVEVLPKAERKSTRRRKNQRWEHPTIKNFKLRPVTIRNKPYWRADTPKPGGGRNSKTCPTWDEGNTIIELAETRIKNDGLNGLALTSRQLQEAQQAFEKLKPYPNVKLMETVNFYIQQHPSFQQSVTVTEAIAKLVETKKTDGRRPRTTKTLRNVLGRFALRFADRQIAEVAKRGTEIDDWLRDLGVAAGTRRTFWLRLHLLFAFAKKRGWCTENPMGKDVEKPTVTEIQIGILKPEQFAKLLEQASEETLPYWSLAGFAGVRSKELTDLSWEDIDFEAKYVYIKAGKTAADRYITIQPALEEWLKAYRGRKGKICPPDLRRKLEADRARAEITPWPANAMRHSFASHFYGYFKDATQLKHELGHTRETTAFKHYRRLVLPKDAKAWWSILPQPQPNIVAMTA